MRVLITGHKGYIGAVAGAMFQGAGHDVIGLDTDLFGGCEFGQLASEIPEFTAAKEIGVETNHVMPGSAKHCSGNRADITLMTSYQYSHTTPIQKRI